MSDIEAKIAELMVPQNIFKVLDDAEVNLDWVEGHTVTSCNCRPGNYWEPPETCNSCHAAASIEAQRADLKALRTALTEAQKAGAGTAEPLTMSMFANRADYEIALAAAGEKSELWRHKKTGGIYRWVNSAVLEADKTVVVTYQCVNSGIRWVRPSTEFYDGRFERVDASPASIADQGGKAP